MNSKLKVIQENCDLDEEEAKLALDLADGNLEQALSMVEYVEKAFFTLQIKFKKPGHSNQVYGLINFIANGKAGELLNLNVVTTYSREVFDIGIEVSNKAFNQTIEEFKEEGSTSYDNEVRRNFYEKLHSADIFELFEMIKRDEIRFIEGEIADVLSEVFSKQVEVDVEANLVTKTQIGQLVNMTVESEEVSEEEEEKESQLSIHLKCSPIISAVKGTRAEDLEVGDEILVRIVDRREIGRYLADLISTEASQITPGMIEDIHFNEGSNRYTFIIEFGPNIYGKLLIDSGVKLATAKDLKREKKEKEQKTEIRERANFQFMDLNLSMPLVILFLVLIILVIILLNSF